MNESREGRRKGKFSRRKNIVSGANEEEGRGGLTNNRRPNLKQS